MSAAEPHPRRGQLYWVQIPDEPGAKRRPALVVSPDVRNRLANDVIVGPLSSVLHEAPTQVSFLTTMTQPGSGFLTRMTQGDRGFLTTLTHPRWARS